MREKQRREFRRARAEAAIKRRQGFRWNGVCSVSLLLVDTKRLKCVAMGIVAKILMRHCISDLLQDIKILLQL
jgi:hypothetical protein